MAVVGSAGPNFPGTVVDDNTVGATVWSNPTNVEVEDGTFATTTVSTSSPQSHYLKATNFGLTIPLGSSITGIFVEAKVAFTSIHPGEDGSVKLVIGGAIVGTDQATSTLWPASLLYKSWGGSSNLWGLSPQATDISSSGFGVAISFKQPGSKTSVPAEADAIRITVTYLVNPISKTRFPKPPQVLVGI